MDFNKEPVTQEEKFGKFIMDLQDEDTAKQAVFQLELMENSGFAEAAVALGQYYKDTNAKKATRHFTIAANADNAEGYWGLAILTEHNTTPDPDNEQDQKWISYCRKAAELGCADARNELGHIYNRMGHVLPATYWYMLASFFDRPDAGYSLEQMAKKWFFDGKPEDTLEGVDGFDVVQQRAASSALELTCGNDDPDIMQDLIRLSMLGDPMASLMLGQVYENVHDYSSAIKYYDEGIQSKDPQAMRCYADLLMMGNGVEKNEGQAISLYKEAAAHGDRTSMYVLGQYENFAIEDPYMAAYWYGMSAARGFEAGRSKLRTLCEERRKS
jgi:hypothetical protein